jgi:hypothetical protein
VIRLNHEISELVVEERRQREAHGVVVATLAETRRRRDTIAAQVRESAGALVAPTAAVPAAAAAPAGPAAPGRPEASSLGIQTLLFLIGGLLLGTGAIVFTVVAWTTFGVAGQAAILAAGTGLALAVPPVARWRRLRGTAETFAVIGLLLVLLDGYAGWRAGLVGDLPGSTWAGLVSGGTALLAVGYARWTRLASPWFAGLVLAQPVLPLLAVEPLRQLPGGAVRLAAVGYLLALLAAGNLALRWRQYRHPDRPAGGAGRGLRIGCWIATGGWLAAAGVVALVGLAVASGASSAGLAGGALLAGAAVLAGVAWLVGRARLPGAGGWAAAAAAGAPLAVALAAGRVAALAWPGTVVLGVAAVVAGVAGLAAQVRGPAPVRRGARVGAAVALGVVGGYLAGLVLWGAAMVAGRALTGTAPLDLGPPYHAPVLAALVLLTAGLVRLLPAIRFEAIAVGLGLSALAVPPALALPWWVPVPAGLLAAAVLALAAVQTGAGRRAVTGAVAAAAVAGHALLVGLATAASLAAVLGGLLGLGLVVAVRACRPAGAAPPVRLVVGRVALLAGLLAAPPAAAAGLLAAGVAVPWPGRAALAVAVALLLAVAAIRTAARRYQLPGYLATAAGAVHVLTPVAILAGLADRVQVLGAYAAAGALGLAALGLLRAPGRPVGWLVLRLPVAGTALLAAAPQLLVLLVGPYSWLGRAWSGPPDGVGLVATAGTGTGAGWPAGGGNVLGLVLLAAATGLSGWVLAGARAGGGRAWRAGLAGALLVAPVAGLAGLAELGAPWPVVPGAGLGLGVALVLAAAVRGGRVAARIGGGYGLALAGAGLAGTLPAQWSTLAGLGVVLAAAVVVGVAGRAGGARVAGWVAAVGFAVALAVAATLAADRSLPSAGFVVLAVAAAALAGARWLPGVPARAVTAAANGSAATALLLAAGAGLSRAGGIAALWGAALGVRALRRTAPAAALPAGGGWAGRTGWAVAAGGCELLAWWLLLAGREVIAVEAYTLPAALLALAVGWWVRRSRPEVGSWIGYGPALAVAALPSLYLTLVDPAPLRRLLLGAAAVAVVVAGARRRLQAPVVVGGGVAVVVAVRELGLLWQQLPTWLPLTAAGLLLVGLAASYERRRRDLARLNAAVRRMT